MLLLTYFKYNLSSPRSWSQHLACIVCAPRWALCSFPRRFPQCCKCWPL